MVGQALQPAAVWCLPLYSLQARTAIGTGTGHTADGHTVGAGIRSITTDITGDGGIRSTMTGIILIITIIIIRHIITMDMAIIQAFTLRIRAERRAARVILAQFAAHLLQRGAVLLHLISGARLSEAQREQAAAVSGQVAAVRARR